MNGINRTVPIRLHATATNEITNGEINSPARHTTATDALRRGMALPELQELYGHVKPETTMIYAKTCNESVKYNHRRFIV